MTNRWVYLSPLVIALTLGIILYTAIGKDPTKLETARLNDPIPAFKLPKLSDANVFLTQENLKGELTLLNVWATWCPSCKAEHGYLNELSKKGVKIIGLNYKDERDPALAWLEKLGNPYEFVIYDKHGKLGFDLGVYGAPETYLVDAKGVVRYRHVGVVNHQVWQSTFMPLIQQYNLTN